MTTAVDDTTITYLAMSRAEEELCARVLGSWINTISDPTSRAAHLKLYAALRAGVFSRLPPPAPTTGPEEVTHVAP